MTAETTPPLLTEDDLRHITRWAVDCAARALPVFEAVAPADLRPRQAIAEAGVFAGGGPRTAQLRKAAWGAQAAASEVADPAAKAAARAAIAAAGAPYTHPIETPHQINHVLGPAPYAIQALAFGASDEAGTIEAELLGAIARASPEIRRIVEKMPGRKPSKGAFHALLFELDRRLRR